MPYILAGADLTPTPTTPTPNTPAPGTPPSPVVPSHGNMTLSSNRGVVYLRGDVEALQGWEGLGPTRRTPNRSTPLGRDGTIRNRLRPITRDERRVVGPCHVAGRTPRERAQLMDKIIDICSPLDGSEVRLTLNRYDEPVYCSGDALFGGASEFMAEAAYDRAALVQLDLSCPDPNFYSVREYQTKQGKVTGAPFFPIGPAILADSTSFGSPLAVRVGGTWPTWAYFRITGPLTNFTATWSDGSSFGFDLTAAPLDGNRIVQVRTDPASATEGALRVQGPGPNLSYWRYMTSRSFRQLQPGTDSITFDVAGETADTVVRMFWHRAYQAVS